MKTSGRQGGGYGDDELGVKARLPRRSVEILRDLGLSKEKIVAYWSAPLQVDRIRRRF